MVADVQQSVSGLVLSRWLNVGNVGTGFWFSGSPGATDPLFITPGQEARRRFALDDAFTVVKHTLQIVLPVAARVSVFMRLTSQDAVPVINLEKEIKLNSDVDLVPISGFQFDIILVEGASYDLKITTGATQNPSIFITESFNVDI